MRETGVMVVTSIKTSGSDDPPMNAEVEGEMREFVERDVKPPRRAPESEGGRVVNDINSLLQRVRGTSVQEIDRLITELQALREILQDKGVRLQREITSYGHLSQSAMETTKIIADSLREMAQQPPGRNPHRIDER